MKTKQKSGWKNAKHRKNLLKLIAFLRKLPPKKFDFSLVIQHSDQNGCGTIGCAIGWCPAVFPDKVSWVTEKKCAENDFCPPKDAAFRVKGLKGTFDDWTGRMIRKDRVPHSHSFTDVARGLFGIPNMVAADLFAPDCEVENKDHKRLLLPKAGHNASPKQVAKRLESFMKHVDSGKATLGARDIFILSNNQDITRKTK